MVPQPIHTLRSLPRAKPGRSRHPIPAARRRRATCGRGPGRASPRARRRRGRLQPEQGAAGPDLSGPSGHWDAPHRDGRGQDPLPGAPAEGGEKERGERGQGVPFRVPARRRSTQTRPRMTLCGHRGQTTCSLVIERGKRGAEAAGRQASATSRAVFGNRTCLALFAHPPALVPSLLSLRSPPSAPGSPWPWPPYPRSWPCSRTTSSCAFSPLL